MPQILSIIILKIPYCTCPNVSQIRAADMVGRKAAQIIHSALLLLAHCRIAGARLFLTHAINPKNSGICCRTR